jgi:hypothetical protein
VRAQGMVTPRVVIHPGLPCRLDGLASSMVIFVADLNRDRAGRIGYFNTTVSGVPPEATDLDIALEPWKKVYLSLVLR